MIKNYSCVTIKCISPCAEGEYEVTGIDASNNTVFHCTTSCDGTATVIVRSAGEYRIRVCSRKPQNPTAINRWLFLCPNKKYTLYFMFDSCLPEPCYTTAKFYLSDKNYDGLPVQEGVIKLCQAPM